MLSVGESPAALSDSRSEGDDGERSGAVIAVSDSAAALNGAVEQSVRFEGCRASTQLEIVDPELVMDVVFVVDGFEKPISTIRTITRPPSSTR